MIRYCFKSKCPKRFSVGNSSDVDSITMVCPRCEKMYYTSDYASNKLKKRIKILATLVVIIIVSLIYIKFHNTQFNLLQSIFPTNNDKEITINITPNNIVNTFFDFLNNKKYKEAYNLTDNEIWPFHEFSQSKIWGGFKNLKVINTRKKYYSSKYGGDYIINVDYKCTVITSNKILERNHDFHLQKQGEKWKIIRMIEPRLDKVDRPNNASDCINKYLTFLNDGQYLKAYLLTDNPTWKPKDHFLSEQGWGCIKTVNIIEVKENSMKSKYGSKIIFAKYYAEDPCNESKEHQFDFHLDNKSDYWKIVRATNSK